MKSSINNKRTSVRKYFDKEAKNYRKKCSSGLLGQLRKREIRGVMQLLRAKPEESILDVGCGSGFYSILLVRKGCNVEGIDISPKMVEIAKRNGIKAKVGDIETFDMKKRFCKILCCGVFEFCENYNPILENLKKHLMPGGYIIILLPLKNIFGLAYKIFHKAHGINIALFSRKEMKRLLEKHNLKIVEYKKVGLFTYIIKVVNGQQK